MYAAATVALRLVGGLNVPMLALAGLVPRLVDPAIAARLATSGITTTAAATPDCLAADRSSSYRLQSILLKSCRSRRSATAMAS